MERGDGLVEQRECDSRLAVGRVQPRGVACEEPVEEVDAMLAHEVDTLVPGHERAPDVDLGQRQTGDPERVGDPVGVAERARGSDRFFGQRERLAGPPGRLEAVDVGSQAVAAVGSVPIRDRAGQFYVAVEVAAVDMPECLDERGVAGLTGVVAGVVLELGGPVRVGAGRVRPPGEAGEAGCRVQPGQAADVGPADRFEQLHRVPHQRGMRRDVGRYLDVAPVGAPAVSGAKVVQLGLDPVDGIPPAGPVPGLPPGGSRPREVCGVPVARAFLQVGLGEAVLGELADGLVHGVAGARGRMVGDDE